MDKYKAELVVEGITYKVLRVSVPREGKKPLVATWGGIPLKWDMQTDLDDRPQAHWNPRSELEKRLLAQVCEQCGVTSLTDQIEVHPHSSTQRSEQLHRPQKTALGQNHGGPTPQNVGSLSNVSQGYSVWASGETTHIKLLNVARRQCWRGKSHRKGAC